MYEKKLKKQNNPKFDEFIMKVNTECFVSNNLLQGFKLMKHVKTGEKKMCILPFFFPVISSNIHHKFNNIFTYIVTNVY